MRPGMRHWVGGIFVSAALVGAVTGVVALLKPHVAVQGLVVLYLPAVLFVAVEFGVVFAVPVSVASALVFTLFLPPEGEFAITDWGDQLALAVFLITAVVAGQLGARLRRQTGEAARLAGEQAALRRVATLVAQATPPAEIFRA